MNIAALHRYPVKGLSPEPLGAMILTAGDYVPGDRLYAIENGPSGFDSANPQHRSKTHFLMLMRNEALARLRTRYDDATATLVVDLDGKEEVRADLATAAGRLAVEAFMRRYVPRELSGPPKVLSAPNGFRFTDSRSGYVSIINVASVAAIADLVGAPVNPLRFRGNIHVEGLEPWAEFDLVGRTLRGPGGLLLKITKRIVRCAAVDVDPVTAERDMHIPTTLMRRLGHMDCGIYASVAAGGTLRTGDDLAADADLFDPSPAITAPVAAR